MDIPKAYFLTWTCYGTWLHGDDRGSVDDRHNGPGQAVVPPHRGYQRFDAERLVGKPFALDRKGRTIVAETLTEHCRIRDWRLLSLNVRTNHVHVVVTCGRTDPEAAMGQLKAWCSRRLREAGLVARADKVWTVHGSTVYLWTDDAVCDTCHYVIDEQGPEI